MKKNKQIKKGNRYYFCPEKRLWIWHTGKSKESVKEIYQVEIVTTSSKRDSLRTDKLMKL